MNDCTCDVKPPVYHHAIGRSLRYAIYITEIEDKTRFDPNCPFHGDNGSMVTILRSTKGIAGGPCPTQRS